MALLLFPAAFCMLGLIIGRWWVVLAAVGVWAGIALFLVVNDGWHGAGWGDGGILLNVSVAASTVLAAAAGVFARRLGARTAAL
jgi:hypothetical protein